jgi:molecular chaperone DnaK (HSP70)
MGLDPAGVTRQNLFDPILSATTKLPAKKSHAFWTVNDGQTEIEIEVYEALIEGPTTAGMTLWDRTEIEIPPAPARSYAIDITFEYSIEQELTVIVEVPEHDMREVWRPAAKVELQGRRAVTEERLDDLRFRSLEALKSYRERVGNALGKAGGEPGVREILDDLDAAIQREDLDEAKRAKRKLGGLLFDQQVSL